jgi:hypothetical protein
MKALLAIALILVAAGPALAEPPTELKCEVWPPHIGYSLTPNYWTAYYSLNPAPTPEGRTGPAPTPPKWVKFVERPLFAGAAVTKQVQVYNVKQLKEFEVNYYNQFIVGTVFGIATGGYAETSTPKPVAGPWVLRVVDNLGRSCEIEFSVPEPNDGCMGTIHDDGNFLCIAE